MNKIKGTVMINDKASIHIFSITLSMMFPLFSAPNISDKTATETKIVNIVTKNRVNLIDRVKIILVLAKAFNKMLLV